MARPGHPIHDLLARLLQPAEGPIVDLGCGTGGTLAAVARLHPAATLVGLDAAAASLQEARALLADHPGEVHLLRAELEAALPLADASAGAVVCHNVLECLAEPGALLREAARVLRPGGRALWSHVDFDGLVVAGADPALARRGPPASADLTPSWAARADGRAGRKLAGLVRHGPLALEGVDVLPLVSSELQGDAAARIEEIAQALAEAGPDRAEGVTPAEIAAWRAQLERAAARGEFLLVELALVARSRR